jgi:hypothetical protein
MSVAIEARDYQQAHENAKKLEELLKGPLVKMAVESEGIRLSGNGNPVVHRPQPEAPGR